MSSILEEVRSKGDGVTSSLRKVTADMKSKNQPDRSSVVKDQQGVQKRPSLFASRVQEEPVVVGEPTMKKETDTWIVKNYCKGSVGDKKFVEIAGDGSDADKAKQTVRISDCADVTFHVTSAKMNSILVCNCVRTNVVVKSLIAGVELCDCRKIKVQVLGVVPSVTVDKTTGFDLYLSEASKGVTALTTSKSGEMNVNFPEDGTKEEEWVEVAIPEQFVHHLDPAKKKLTTQVSALYSC
eukprot:GHVS01026988.1.p1 GENE.GHVS01026988.1~~GHVS01026988.1.p1  ORF type:complete len:239 (-),score=64.07 GHVS01026988.1:716-1432(-)